MKRLILAVLFTLSGAVHAEDNLSANSGISQLDPQASSQMMQRIQSMSPEQRAQMMEKAREFIESMTPEQRAKMQGMLQQAQESLNSKAQKP